MQTRLTLADLMNRHAGRPAAVLGGGPSLQNDMRRLPMDCVNLAVNAHPYLIGIHEPDYLVFMDDPQQDKRMIQALKGSSGLKVCPDLAHSDVDLRGLPHSVFRGSGIVAAWLAVWCGCDPVVLCGMDLYQGDAMYCHEEYAERQPDPLPLEKHLARWRTLPDVSRVYAASGPLTAEFKAYLN